MSDPRSLHGILDVVSRVYHHELSQGVSGLEGRRYLAKRWVFGHAMDQWRLGWSPPRRNGGMPWIATKMEGHATISQLKEIGVLVETDRGLEDPMAGRVVFPQVLPTGHVAGFVGRVVDGAHPGKDKYVATPQTALFRRSEILYRVDLSRKAIESRREAVIVEGLLDAVLMWQIGARHVVATGTAGMTDAQAQILSRYADRLGVMFDSDDAGQEAAEDVRRSQGVYFRSVEKMPVPQGAGDPARWAEMRITAQLTG